MKTIPFSLPLLLCPLFASLLCSCQNLVHVTEFPNGSRTVNVAANLLGKQKIPHTTVQAGDILITVAAGGTQDGEGVAKARFAKEALIGGINGVAGGIASVGAAVQ